MDTLKTKTAKSNHVIFNICSILCTSIWCHIYTKVLINKMCLWIYCCRIATHIWWISHM